MNVWIKVHVRTNYIKVIHSDFNSFCPKKLFKIKTDMGMGTARQSMSFHSIVIEQDRLKKSVGLPSRVVCTSETLRNGRKTLIYHMIYVYFVCNDYRMHNTFKLFRK